MDLVFYSTFRHAQWLQTIEYEEAFIILDNEKVRERLSGRRTGRVPSIHTMQASVPSTPAIATTGFPATESIIMETNA